MRLSWSLAACDLSIRGLIRELIEFEAGSSSELSSGSDCPECSPRSSESLVASVSVFDVMFVTRVEADSVLVLIVASELEAVEVPITTTWEEEKSEEKKEKKKLKQKLNKIISLIPTIGTVGPLGRALRPLLK